MHYMYTPFRINCVITVYKKYKKVQMVQTHSVYVVVTRDVTYSVITRKKQHIT